MGNQFYMVNIFEELTQASDQLIDTK